MGLVERIIVDNATITLSVRAFATLPDTALTEIAVYFGRAVVHEHYLIEDNPQVNKELHGDLKQESYEFAIPIAISKVIGITNFRISVRMTWSSKNGSYTEVCEDVTGLNEFENYREDEFYTSVQSFVSRSSNPWLLLCKSLIALSNDAFSVHAHVAALCVATYRIIEINFYDCLTISFLNTKVSALLAEDWKPLREPLNLRWYSSLLMAGGYVSIMSNSLPIAEKYFSRQCTLSGMLYLEPQMIFKIVRAGFYIAYIRLVRGDIDSAVMQFRQISTGVEKIFSIKSSDFTFHEILEIEKSISTIKEAIRITLILNNILNINREESESPDYLLRFSGEVVLSSVDNLRNLVNKGFLPTFSFENKHQPPELGQHSDAGKI